MSVRFTRVCEEAVIIAERAAVGEPTRCRFGLGHEVLAPQVLVDELQVDLGLGGVARSKMVWRASS